MNAILWKVTENLPNKIDENKWNRTADVEYFVEPLRFIVMMGSRWNKLVRPTNTQRNAPSFFRSRAFKGQIGEYSIFDFVSSGKGNIAPLRSNSSGLKESTPAKIAVTLRQIELRMVTTPPKNSMELNIYIAMA